MQYSKLKHPDVYVYICHKIYNASRMINALSVHGKSMFYYCLLKLFYTFQSEVKEIYVHKTGETF